MLYYWSKLIWFSIKYRLRIVIGVPIDSYDTQHSSTVNQII